MANPKRTKGIKSQFRTKPVASPFRTKPGCPQGQEKGKKAPKKSDVKA